MVVGFVAGATLGLGFDRADWLGGYDSPRRRLLRLAHISFIALGILNIQYAHSALPERLSGSLQSCSSWLLIAGAILMPATCYLMAYDSRAKPLFALPILCLIAAGTAVVRAALSP